MVQVQVVGGEQDGDERYRIERERGKNWELPLASFCCQILWLFRENLLVFFSILSLFVRSYTYTLRLSDVQSLYDLNDYSYYLCP